MDIRKISEGDKVRVKANSLYKYTQPEREDSDCSSNFDGSFTYHEIYNDNLNKPKSTCCVIL